LLSLVTQPLTQPLKLMKKFIYTFALLAFVSSASFAQETKSEGTIKIINQDAGSTKQATPLYILDDVEMPGNDLGAIKPEEIDSVTVLKEAKAVEPYGEKGKNGVVIITTKKYKAKKSKLGH
jgi:TonB-dependent SusC/RagA subfamily outer membrane receptor